MGFPHFLFQKMIDLFSENLSEDYMASIRAEAGIQFLISLRLET
jgi:hypothetical protein